MGFKMGLKWSQSVQIAEYLYDNNPTLDPMSLRFTQLREKVMALPEFDDDPNHCGERVLEAIQMAWLDEYQ